jgi:hypothetical protein
LREPVAAPDARVLQHQIKGCVHLHFQNSFFQDETHRAAHNFGVEISEAAAPASGWLRQ